MSPSGPGGPFRPGFPSGPGGPGRPFGPGLPSEPGRPGGPGLPVLLSGCSRSQSHLQPTISHSSSSTKPSNQLKIWMFTTCSTIIIPVICQPGFPNR